MQLVGKVYVIITCHGGSLSANDYDGPNEKCNYIPYPGKKHLQNPCWGLDPVDTLW